MKSSERIVFEISKESSLDKAVEILETYIRVAIEDYAKFVDTEHWYKLVETYYLWKSKQEE